MLLGSSPFHLIFTILILLCLAKANDRFQDATQILSSLPASVHIKTSTSSESEFVYEAAEQLSKSLRNGDKTEEGPEDGGFHCHIGKELDYSKSELALALGKVPQWVVKKLGCGYLEKGWGHLQLRGSLGEVTRVTVG